MATHPPSPRWQCARCGAIDPSADRRAALGTLAVAFFTFLALMWHPLLAFVLVVGAVLFRLTTRRRICDVCGYDGRDDTRPGFRVRTSTEAGEQRRDRPANE
jgi:hypothetical protein